MLLLSQIPKLNTHLTAAVFSLSSLSSYTRRFSHPLYLHLHPNPSFRALKSTIASHIPSLNDAVDVDLEVDEPVQLSIDKLFIPPDTDVSSSLTARVLKGSNIVLSKYARDAQVTTAEFVKSSVNTVDCPAEGLPEFALVGRSNVGKSSLLNSIVKRKKLALTSKKPGECFSLLVIRCLIKLLTQHKAFWYHSKINWMAYIGIQYFSVVWSRVLECTCSMKFRLGLMVVIKL